MVLLERALFSDIKHDPIKSEPLAIDADAVLYAVKNLITTEIGERHNLVEYGVNLSDELFEIIDDLTSWRLITSLIYAINRWEPRVTVDTARSYAHPMPDENAYDLNLVLNIEGLPGIDFSISGVYKKFKGIMES